MKKLLIPAALLISLSTIGQDRHINLGLEIGTGSTSIHNKHDRSLADSVYYEDGQWQVNYGINLKVTNPDSRLYSYGIGLQYMSYSSKYGGDYLWDEFAQAYYPVQKEGTVNLDYIAIPLNIELGLLESSKGVLYLGLAYVPHIQTGYSERYKEVSGIAPGFMYTTEYEIENERWQTYLSDELDGMVHVLHDDLTFRSPLYKKVMHSLRFSLGYDLHVNERLNIGFHIDYMRALSDVENKDEISYDYVDFSGNTGEYTERVFGGMDEKWEFNDNYDRPATHWAYLGGGIGFYYSF